MQAHKQVQTNNTLNFWRGEAGQAVIGINPITQRGLLEIKASG